MRTRLSTVCTLATVVLASFLADRRAPARIHPESLARIEAIVSYCEKADPNTQSRYLSKLLGVTSGHSQEEIQRDRETSRYRLAMAEANEVLSKVTEGTGIRACTDFLTEK